MTIQELQSHFTQALTPHYPETEVHSFFSILTAHYLNYNRFQISTNKEKELTLKQKNLFNEAIERLLRFEPVQHITGEQYFYGLDFKVNKHTLIPRPETEELCEWIINDCKHINHPHMLDIGTGSGCIAVILAKMVPGANVSAIDISKKALNIAQENARLHNVDVHFSQLDILKAKVLPQKYHVIVSNPPYIRSLEKKLMHANVLDFEPESALFVENTNALVFYRAIAALATKYLHPQGHLYFEINEFLGQETVDLLTNMGFKNVVLKKDIHKKNRMIKCSL